MKLKSYYSVLRACKLYIQMTTTKRQRKMFYRSSVTVNFVCATKFCFDPPFFNGSSPLALSRPSTPRITHCARANWLVSPPILSSALIKVIVNKLFKVLSIHFNKGFGNENRLSIADSRHNMNDFASTSLFASFCRTSWV